MMHRPFVAIVGAGPVGLMMANLLGRAGHPVLLLERRTEPYTIPRAIAYDGDTLRLFSNIGLLDALEPTLEQDVPVRYLNAAGRTIMYMGKLDRRYGHSMLGTFHQPEMEAVLAAGLARYPSVIRLDGAEVVSVTQGPDSARIEWRRDGVMDAVEADYIIGCDGGSSFVRQAAGIGFSGTTFTERWLVVDCEDEGHGLQEMQFFCDPARPALTLPVSRGRRRWEFLLLPGESPEELEREDVVRGLIAGYAPNDRSRITRSLVYTFHARNADRYRSGRVLLAGDAAHVSPPFAGQGLNGGLRDANALAWRLDMIARGSANDSVLESYESERKPHVQRLTDLAIWLGQTIMPISPVRALFRDAVLLAQRTVPAYRRHVERGGLVKRPALGKGLMREKCRQAGHPVVNPLVLNADGQSELLDAKIGTGWALVGIGVDPDLALHLDDRDCGQRIGTSLIAVAAGAAPELEKQIGAGKVALVRPDRMIADVFRPGPAPALGWLSDALGISTTQGSVSPARDPRMARASAPVALARELAFTMFDRPDLDVMERFLGDFGLKRMERKADRLVMRTARGPGPAHICWKADTAKFVGLALRVRSRQDLDALACTPGASPVEPLDLPGGGLHVRMVDPAGLAVWAIAEQEDRATDPLRAPLTTNTPFATPRQNTPLRPPRGPANVLRIGHCAIGAVDFFATTRWYMDMFGLIPSDVQSLSDDSPALCFMRCNRGDEPADHHTIVVAQNVTNGFSHAAFEVVDIDDVAMGQEHLLAKGWKHAWGIGRHVLGSQIFDYWRDPAGDKLEHYADGDLFDADAPTGWSRLDTGSIYMWGPPVPADFEKPRLTPAMLWRIVRNVQKSPELDWARVRKMLAAISAPSRPWAK